MGRARKKPEETPVEETAAEAPPVEEAAAETPRAAAEEAPVSEEAAATEELVSEQTPAATPKKRAAPKKKAASKKAAAKARKVRSAKRSSGERKPIVRQPKPERVRGHRKERRGVVVSSAMDKTIVVRVDAVKPHPRYKKVVRRSQKLHAHDEENVAKPGDVVRVVETRPISRTKHWRLAEVVEVAQ